MKKKLFIIPIILCWAVLLLSSCDVEVKEYKTYHESGTINVNNFDDLERLAFRYRASLQDVARAIPDFCIYQNNEDYKASARVDMSNFLRDYGIIRLYSDKLWGGGALNEWWYNSTNYTEISAKEFADSDLYFDVYEDGKWEKSKYPMYDTEFRLELRFNPDKELIGVSIEYNSSQKGKLSGTEIFASTLQQKYSCSEESCRAVDYEEERLFGKAVVGNCLLTNMYFENDQFELHEYGFITSLEIGLTKDN